jgi:hypothetical protein
MADATRELIVQDFATKGDIAALKSEIAGLEQRGMAKMEALEQRGMAKMEALEQRIMAKMEALEQSIMGKMDTLSLRLTVRLGGLIAVGVAILAAIIKL